MIAPPPRAWVGTGLTLGGGGYAKKVHATYAPPPPKEARDFRLFSHSNYTILLLEGNP